MSAARKSENLFFLLRWAHNCRKLGELWAQDGLRGVRIYYAPGFWRLREGSIECVRPASKRASAVRPQS